MKRAVDGFSLVEVVFAATLLALGGLCLLDLLPTVWVNAKTTQQRAQAELIAQNLIEIYRGDPVNISAHPCEPVNISGAIFHPVLTITDSQPHLKNIFVSVTWRTTNKRELKTEQQIEVCKLPR